MSEEMRLQKYLARSGVASRRASEELIEAGHVSVNGNVVTEMGCKVVAGVDTVCVDGKVVTLIEENVTLMLHKPAGYVTTMDDPQGRADVAQLIPLDTYPSLFPVGRLDRDTTGLLLFSTDGELGERLLHPRHHVPKTYYALCDGRMSRAQADKLEAGVVLGDGPTQPSKVDILLGAEAACAAQLLGHDEGASGLGQRHDGKNARDVVEKTGTYLRITIREGKKRQVRRMCEFVGHPVVALHRECFGPLVLGDLPRGSWRLLTEREVQALKDAIDSAQD